MEHHAPMITLPDIPRISFDPPEDRDHVEGVTPLKHGGRVNAGNKKLPPPKRVIGGETIDDAGIGPFKDFRLTAEVNERNIETRRRALHGTMFAAVAGGTDGDAVVAKLTKKSDDPLADERAVGAFGWLMKLETRDPGLRLMSINRSTMAVLAIMFRDMGGAGMKPKTWPFEDPKTKAKTLAGLEVNAVGFITALRMPNNELCGAIPREMASGMPACHEIDLHNNKRLGGLLPGSLGSLNVCTRVDLSGCGFDGPLPQQLSLMGSLRTLLLNECEFTGLLPAGLVDLERLEVLDLAGNRFHGDLPRSWGRLKELKVLRLARNMGLVGSIPDSWAELGRLEELDVRGCRLGGPIPKAILQLLQPGSVPGLGGQSGGGGSGGGEGEGEEGAAEKGGSRLRICRLRGNDWDATIPRWPEGILLNRCTDLALVDLPGTTFMTSRDGARRLLHAVATTGDLAGSDGNAVAGGGSASLLRRSLRPPTAQSPRVVAATVSKWQPVAGGGAVSAGFRSLSLEAAPVPCQACRGVYPVCLCVASCAACGRFNRERAAQPRRPGKAGGGEGGACKGCGLTEPEAVKFRAGAAAGAKAAAAVKAAVQARDEREKLPQQRATEGGGSKGLRMLYPPLPTDLLRVPTSQALSSFDPYADNFPF